jgi:hypothetical protein
MTKTFTFGKTNNNKSNYSFLANPSSTNYSKILDDIILADIIDKNQYLFDKTKKESADIFLDNTSEDIILTGGPKLYNAAKFITNYKLYTKKYNLPFTLGKMYTLTDGTPIIFYDDEIQIGFDTYKYSSLSNLSFLNSLTTDTKKIIINIYNAGSANIKINLL